MITYTHPDVLGDGVTAGWADPETDPTRIDWAARQQDAEIWFDVVDGRPVNPFRPTAVRYGRNELGHWGEARAADAVVTAATTGGRFILLVERGDGHGWALPGGMLEPGETPDTTAVRELAEETGLRLPTNVDRFVLATRYVPDPRASDEAWIVTTPVTADLGHHDDGLPVVAGGDDARRAAWLPADSYAELGAWLHKRYAGTVFVGHQRLLRDVLDGPGEAESYLQSYIDDELAGRTGGQLRAMAGDYLRLVSAIEMTMADISDWRPGGDGDGLSEVEHLTCYLEHLTEATRGPCELCGREIYAPHQITDLPDRPLWHPRRWLDAAGDFYNSLRYGGYRIAHRDCADLHNQWPGRWTR
jgi:ADP-ribose pyrophosphatase